VINRQAPLRRTPLATEQRSHPNTQQFSATPRFKPTGTPNVPSSTPYAPRYLISADQVAKREDIVDDASNGTHDMHDSIEKEDQDIDPELLFANADIENRIEERNPKRRRLSSSPIPENDDQALEDREGFDDLKELSPLATVASPPKSRHPVSSTAPRFLPSTQSFPQPTEVTFHKPPRFLPLDASEQGHLTDPLPQQFSPHRRGQKYVAGGLAAEVRDWLVNIESAIPSNSTSKKDSPWLLKFMIDAFSGGERAGMTLVRGHQVLSDDLDGVIDSLGVIRVILAGEGAGTGLQKDSKVEVGKVVGIKDPLWDVVIEGEKWGVGVDWKVLAEPEN
jgi:hypothetical protein